MKSKIKMMTATMLLFAGTAVAQTQGVPGTAKQEPTTLGKVEVDADKIRCERTNVTGSRLGAKVCHKESEWALIEQRADELMHDIERVPVGFKPNNQPSRLSGSLSDGL